MCCLCGRFRKNNWQLRKQTVVVITGDGTNGQLRLADLPNAVQTGSERSGVRISFGFLQVQKLCTDIIYFLTICQHTNLFSFIVLCKCLCSTNFLCSFDTFVCLPGKLKFGGTHSFWYQGGKKNYKSKYAWATALLNMKRKARNC